MDHYEAGPKTPDELDPPSFLEPCLEPCILCDNEGSLDGIDGYEEPAKSLPSDHDATGQLFACLEAIGEWVDLTVDYLGDDVYDPAIDTASDLLQKRWDEHFTAKWQVIELVGRLYREFMQVEAALMKLEDAPTIKRTPGPGQLILPGQE